MDLKLFCKPIRGLKDMMGSVIINRQWNDGPSNQEEQDNAECVELHSDVS